MKLAPGQEIHDGHRKDGHNKAGQRELRSLLHPQFPAGTADDIGGKREQQGSANSGGSSFRVLGDRLSMSKLNREAPNQYARRSQLNQTVNAKSEEGQAVRLDRRTDCDR